MEGGGGDQKYTFSHRGFEPMCVYLVLGFLLILCVSEVVTNYVTNDIPYC